MVFGRAAMAFSVATAVAVVAGLGAGAFVAPAREKLALIDTIAASAVDISDANSMEIAPPDGAYVRAYGMPKADVAIRDLDLGVSRDVLVLSRKSKILQWVETKTRIGKVDHYGYRIDWVQDSVDSAQFHPGDVTYFNGGRIPFPDTQFVAPLSIAGRKMSARFMDSVWEWKSIKVSQSDVDAMPEAVRRRYEVRQGDLYSKGNAINGSVWISYSAKVARPISVLGVIHGGRIDPVDLGDGVPVLKMGNHSASALMAEARSSAVASERVATGLVGAIGGVGYIFAAGVYLRERRSRPRPPEPMVVWGRG